MDRELEVVVLEAGNHAAYGLCGLPYFLSDVVADIDSLRAYPPTFFRDHRDIDLRFGAEVVRIDVERQVVHFRSAERKEHLHYDKLVLTAGSTPSMPPVPGLDDDHVFTVRDVAESVRLRGLLDAGHVGHATVVGGGYIGLEVAESLSERGISVTLVEALPRLMANLDPEFSQRVEDEVRQHADVRLDSGLDSLLRTDKGLTLQLTDGTSIETDVVVVATGVRPASTLGSSIGADTGPHGALLVDEHMRTSVPNVFAAGDCIAPNHIVTGRPAFIPLGPTANKTGRVAGTVAAGGSAFFPGIAGTAIVKVFSLGVGRTGLTLGEALSAGFDAHATDAVGRSRAKYFPGSARVDVRLVHTGDGRLLGAQFVGPGDDVAKRVDVTAVALHAGLGVEEIADLDLSYAPPFAPVYEPVLLAANAAVASLKPATESTSTTRKGTPR
jgi:CoA-dependent NAD(P)H sulfur oxidoreductase